MGEWQVSAVVGEGGEMGWLLQALEEDEMVAAGRRGLGLDGKLHSAQPLSSLELRVNHLFTSLPALTPTPALYISVHTLTSSFAYTRGLFSDHYIIILKFNYPLMWPFRIKHHAKWIYFEINSTKQSTSHFEGKKI